MKTSEKKKLITTNLAVWMVAMVTHPLVQMLPTASTAAWNAASSNRHLDSH